MPTPFTFPSAHALAAAVKAVKPATARPGRALPALSMIRLTPNTATASDLDVTAVYTLPHPAPADPGAAFYATPAVLLSACKGATARRDFPVTVDPEAGTIQANGATHAAGQPPADEIPTPPTAPDIYAVTVPTADLLSVARSASTDTTRPILTGVWLHPAHNGRPDEMVATDSYRLHARSIPAPTLPRNTPHGIPARAVKMLPKRTDDAAAIYADADQREGAIVCGHLSICYGAIEGEFPNYTGLIPDNPDPSNLFTAAELRTAAALPASKNLPVTLHTDGTATTDSASTVYGPARPAHAEACAYHPKYLADLVDGLPDETPVYGNPTRPAILTADEGRTTRLLMPVRTR